MAYGLETKGARVLQQVDDCDRGQPEGAELIRWKKAYTRRTEWFLEHQLMVSDFRCAIHLALRETTDIELVTWQQGRDSWFRVSVPSPRRRVARVAPDAYFALRQGEEVRHFFLEADRSSEEHRRLITKYIGYWWHLQDRRFAATRGGPLRVNVLFVTTGERRMANMIETLRQMPKPNRAGHGGKGAFRFCLARDVTIDDPLWIFRSIWRMGASNGVQRLTSLSSRRSASAEGQPETDALPNVQPAL